MVSKVDWTVDIRPSRQCRANSLLNDWEMSVLFIKNLCGAPWISQAQSSWLPKSFCQSATLYMYSLRGESYEFHCSIMMSKSVNWRTNVVGRSEEFIPLAFGYNVLK